MAPFHPRGSQVPSVASLENDRLSLAVSTETGRLTALKSKAPGWDILGRPELSQAFRLLVPGENRRNCTIEEPPCPPTSITADSDRITLGWDADFPTLCGPVALTLLLSISLDGDAVRFSGQVTNRSTRMIECVTWPFVGDVHPPQPDASLDRINIAYAGMSKTPVFPTFRSSEGYWGVDHPLQCAYTPEAPFTLLQSEEQGLFVGNHEADAVVWEKNRRASAALRRASVACGVSPHRRRDVHRRWETVSLLFRARESHHQTARCRRGEHTPRSQHRCVCEFKKQ